MRKALTGFWWSPASEGVVALVVTALFFALGSFLGLVISSVASMDGVTVMYAYLEQFLSLAREDGLSHPELFPFVWQVVRWPTLALLFGFSSLGLMGLPILNGMRGFYLAFSVGAFAQTYGRNGAVAALLLLGIPAFLSIPAFFLLSAQSFSASYKLAVRASGQGKRELPYHRVYMLRCVFAVILIGIGASLEWYLVPALAGGWANILLQ